MRNDTLKNATVGTVGVVNLTPHDLTMYGQEPARPEILTRKKWSREIYGEPGNYATIINGVETPITDEQAEELTAYREAWDKYVQNPVLKLPGEKATGIPAARVSTRTVKVGEINGFPLLKTEYGEVENLPDPKPGTYYVVSLLVAGRVTERTDILTPGDQIRDEEGHIVGAKAWNMI